MSDDPQEDAPKVVTVRSDLATPTRPGGDYGIHQPVRPSAPVHPPQETPSDETLTRHVRKALADDGRIAGCPIDVSVERGVVRLDGAVAEEFQSSFAVSLANSVPGVLNVVDVLRVESR